jgi:phosphoribosylformylglycinamidine synthase
MLTLIERRLLTSAHDVSEGGLLVAIAEAGICGGWGARLELEETSEEALFGE